MPQQKVYRGRCGRLSASRSPRSAAFIRSTRPACWTVADAPPRIALYRSGPRWTFGSRLNCAARSSSPARYASSRRSARLRWSIRSPRPARLSARFASCSHAWRVFSSQSPALAARDFRAPPFSGAFALWRLNHCSPLRSIPSLPRLARDLAAHHSAGRAYLRPALQGAHWLGGVPGSKGILKMRAQLAGSVSVWRRAVVLPLCVCLLAAGSAQAAENQVVLPVRASETERLRDMLSGKRIDASFADGNRLRGSAAPT